MSLTREKIDLIRQSVDIVDVISMYLPLTKKGQNYVSICPFHDDSHPSMSISPQRQIYKCFVCSKGGNVFTFLQDYLHISFIEAVVKVAQIANIDVSEVEIKKQVQTIAPELEVLYKMNQQAKEVYMHYLHTKLGVQAMDYLHDRAMSDEIIKYFEIGYAPKQASILPVFTNVGYKELDMYRSGLIIEGHQKYERFMHRLMFPIHDATGKVVAFSGRILEKNSKDAKYMNSPESQIFTKGNVLYNYHRAKEAMKDQDSLFICEGFMDAIAFYKIGVKNVVSIMGTALTKGHLGLLHRLTKKIKICLDGDQAGKNATINCIELLEKDGFEVSVVCLPAGKDPDEVLEEKGKDELIAISNNPKSSILFKMDYYFEKSNLQNYEEKKEYLIKMVGFINALNDEVDRQHYLSLLEHKTDLDQSVIQTIYKQSSRTYTQPLIQPQRTSIKETKEVVSKYVRAERELLYYMLEDSKVASKYEKEIGYMSTNTYKVIAGYIVEYYRKNFVLEIADFINGIDDASLIQQVITISELELPPLKIKEGNKMIMNYCVIDDYISMIKSQTELHEKEELILALKNTQDVNQQAKILQQILALDERGNYE